MQPTSRRPESGFSLIEAVVAVFLISISVPAIAAMQLQAMKYNADVSATDQLQAIGRAKAQELQAVPRASLIGGEDDVQLPGGTALHRVWTVKQDAPVKGVAKVTLEVTDPNDPDAKPYVTEFLSGSDF